MLKSEAVDVALSDMRIEEAWGGEQDAYASGNAKGMVTHPISAPSELRTRSQTPKDSASQSSADVQTMAATPKSEEEQLEETLGGDIVVKLELGKAPKLSRKSSQKVIQRPAPVFDDLPDSTEEAVSVFQVIPDCIYGSKYMGHSEHDALDCDCTQEWSKSIQHCSTLFMKVLTLARRWHKLGMWRRFGLHQSRHKNGVCSRRM